MAKNDESDFSEEEMEEAPIEEELDPEEEKLLDAGEGEDEGTVETKGPSPPTTAQEVNDDDDGAATDSDEEDEPELPDGLRSPSKKDVAKKERERLREQKRLKKQQLEEFRQKQNDLIDKETDKSAKGRVKFLLQQTEIFAHFAKGNAAAASGKGRNYSKKTEREEDEEIIKETEDADDPVVGGGTRLQVQPNCIKGKMRDYQLAGLNWLIRCYENGINGILADEMGLGKTLQTISLLGFLHEFKGITGPHLVIVPKSTLGNWMKEIARFCPILRAFKFHGNQEERAYQKDHEMVAGKFDVCVTSYEVIIKEKNAFKKFSWRYIIIDEAHRIKNENSLLSKTIRMFSSNYRLLITGTPLQNNLHELWALLNFLLPEIFSSAETFDEWFQVSDDKDQQEVVQQLHKVLRPFLLRRLKSDVERGLPPKKETILKIGLSEMQKTYYKALLQKDIDVINSGGERSRLLNIAMQLRKCCNHPYLFQGAEPGPPYTTGDHLVENAGKMVLLDKLLPKLKSRDSRVLIFSQMTRLLDILEDYLLYRGYAYCRIDGNTSGEDRESQIDEYNREGSSKFVFLLSTRAGGLGINLATADIVILYDSDWNPQVDLQAMDRAHRIGQKKEVQVFRFCTEFAIEEKVIERAYKKLALDAMVIQQGRLAESRAVNKDELLQMVRYGAEKVFSTGGSTITDEDIDNIIAKGDSSTRELEGKMKKFTEDAARFKMDGGEDLYAFEGVGFEKANKKLEGGELKKMIAENWIEPPKRERKRNYSEAEYYRQAMRTGAGPSKPREPRIPRMPVLHDFQFFNIPRLTEIYEKEVKITLQEKARKQREDQKQKESAAGSDAEQKEEEKEEEPEEVEQLTPEEEAEKEQLLQEGFDNWSRRDFNAFIRANEKYGRHDLASIATEIEGKTPDEVQDYAAVFWDRYQELNDWEKFIKNIERGEQRIARKDEMMQAIERKLARYRNPWYELKIQYGQNKGKLYTEEDDRFLLCMVNKLGYGNWDELKAAFRVSPMFRFDWYVKSRTPQELARRCDTLIRLVERENQELAEKEEAFRRQQKKAAKSSATPGRSAGKAKLLKGTPTNSGNDSAGTGKKRRQGEPAISTGKRKKV